MELTEQQVDEIYIKNIKKNKKKKGLSQLELALNLGYKPISIISLGEIYKNKKHFNITQLAKISKVLNVAIYEFFEGVYEIIKK